MAIPEGKTRIQITLDDTNLDTLDTLSKNANLNRSQLIEALITGEGSRTMPMIRMNVVISQETRDLLEHTAALEKRSLSNLIDVLCSQGCERLLRQNAQTDVEAYAKKGRTNGK